jgi:hypothetical protein
MNWCPRTRLEASLANSLDHSMLQLRFSSLKASGTRHFRYLFGKIYLAFQQTIYLAMKTLGTFVPPHCFLEISLRNRIPQGFSNSYIPSSPRAVSCLGNLRCIISSKIIKKTIHGSFKQTCFGGLLSSINGNRDKRTKQIRLKHHPN